MSTNSQEPLCECTGPGFCTRYQIMQDEYAYGICSGLGSPNRSCSQHKSNVFRTKWRLRLQQGKHASLQTTEQLISLSEQSRVVSPTLSPRTQTCIHFGKPTGEKVNCPTCKGNIQLSLFSCSIHTKCTPQTSIHDVQCCKNCPDYTTSQSNQPPQLLQLSPITTSTTPATPPLSISSRKVLRWAYGITSVNSRVNILLYRTIDSLRRGGFDSPRLFIDGLEPESVSRIQSQYSPLEITSRYPVVRTFGNWLLSILELYIRDPQADRYVIFQDDIICSYNLRSYLESCTYPDGVHGSQPRGYWNLCTYPSNEALCPKNSIGSAKEGWYLSNQLGRGAQGLVFSRAALIDLLSSSYMFSRPQDPIRGWRNVDGGIVTAMRNVGWKEYVHNPSLVFHVGEESTIGHNRQPDASTFRGEEYNLLQLLRDTKG